MREGVGVALRWFAGLALHLSLTAADWMVAVADRIDPQPEDEEPPEDQAFDGFVPVTSASDRSDVPKVPALAARRRREDPVPEDPPEGSLEARLKRLRRIQ